MNYVISGCLILGTHYLMKENQWLKQQKLWQLLLGILTLLSLLAIISTWMGTLLPVIFATVICATVLQIKYSYQFSS
ncbi:hypothetical protein GIX45_25505 [Erwinia sp. CPCC 100877]|nr:hypothetical protein [Erwinia sp. CPCC 100877]